MNFSDRIDRLMQVMGTNNNQLAKALNLDASLISRWRTGKRAPKKIEGHAFSIAAYYARSAQAQFQKQALMEIMGLELQEAEEDKLTGLLTAWLMQGEGTLQGDTQTSLPSREIDSTQVDATLMTNGAAAQAAVKHFWAELEKSEAGDIWLYCPGSMEWMHDTDSFEDAFSAFRRVLTSGRSVTFLLSDPNRKLRQDAVMVWSRLAVYGDFRILVPEYCPSRIACCISRHGALQVFARKENEWQYMLNRTGEWGELLQADMDYWCKQAKTVLYSQRHEEFGSMPRATLRTRFSLKPPAKEDAFEGMQILVLPHPERWKPFFEVGDARILRERVYYVKECLSRWEEWIGEKRDPNFHILISPRIHTGHFENLDIDLQEDRMIYQSTDEHEYLAVMTDPSWVSSLRNEMLEGTELITKHEAILEALRRYRDQILGEYTFLSTDEKRNMDEVEITETEHPVYGNCMVCARGDENGEQFFSVRSDRVLILSMSAQRPKAEAMLSLIRTVYVFRELPIYALASLEGAGEAGVTELQALGFAATGVSCWEDGTRCSAEESGRGRKIRVEMKFVPQKS